MTQGGSAIDCSELLDRIQKHLRFIYRDSDFDEQQLALLSRRLHRLMRLDQHCENPRPHHNHWDQREIAIISYGDSFKRDGERPLETLRKFMHAHLTDVIGTLHILPFFPWSSDDGFAVIDYLQVNKSLGDWSDITALASEFRLMADLVLNHASARSRWFEQFLLDEAPGKDMFFCASPEDDLSLVVRPRATPVLRAVQTRSRRRYVWCTFSHDQVDFDFRNPEVLCEFVSIMRQYLDRGVRIFRLDAVAFIWKRVGSSCLNLVETHEIVRLLRTLVEHANSGALIITETNIPNRENLAYFGNANEAHCVYNFSLPPLLLNTLVTGDCRHLKNWMMSMPPAQNGTCYFNFIASHDGIGLRPAEGLLDEGEIDALVETMEGFGGATTLRAVSEGKFRPYEINISLFDAMAGTIKGRDEYQIQRFICAHTIMLALEGIPGIYVHSMLGTENDYDYSSLTGYKRHINRHQWNCDELERVLADNSTHHGEVLRRMRELIQLRRAQAAFHPNATQYVLHLGNQIFAFWRQSIDRRQSLFCLNNVSDQKCSINLADINLIDNEHWRCLISGVEFAKRKGTLELLPYQTCWLSNV